MCKLYHFLPVSQLLLCSIVTTFLIGLFLSPPLAIAAGPTVNVWLTTSDGSNQLTPQANLTFGSNTGNSSTITVNEYQKLQQMDGFGAAVTHTLKVRVTGNQSGQATWNGINPDRVDIVSSSVTTVDDSVQGSGLNQLNYIGSGWNHCTNCDNNNYGFYNGSNSWDNIANDYVTITFNGTQIEFYGVVGPPHGIGAFSIDGGSETTLDFYSPTNAGNAVLYISPVLAAGQYTLKVRVTGNQSGQATWNGINPDRADIIS